jgi:murein DD-endopeptidase MepM/ murein hydrolase activator NlpD
LLAAEEPSNAAPADSPQTTGILDESPTGEHPVRAKLLARAKAAVREPEPADPAASELDAIGRDSKSRPVEVELDLGRTPSTRPPSAPFAGRRRQQLSPNLIAVFGTLLGLATVASLVALVLGIDSRKAAAPVVTAPAPATSAEAPVAERPAVKRRARQKQPGPWRIADAKNEAGLKTLEGKVGAAPFLKAVQDAGVQRDEAYRVLQALKDVKDLDKCQKSDRFLALVDRSSARLKAFEYVAGDEEVYQAREGADGLLVGKKLDLKVARNQISGSLVYEGGQFESAAENSGFDPGLSKVLTKALDGHSGIEELSRGDRLRIVAQEVTVLGEFSRYSGVEAVEITFADPKQKPLRIYYFQGAESRGYFDDRGRQPYDGGWRKPVKDAAMTSPFNPKRLHPILKKIMPHNGIDFGAATGTPVLASSFGTVSFLGPAGASGNLVKIEHPGGIETGYAHLSRFAEGLKAGDHVKRLQLVGYVGSTGRSTGPHLHFSAEKDGKFFDPQTLNLDGMRVLSKGERELFLQVKQKYDRLLDAVAMPEALPAAAPAVAEPQSPDPGDDPEEAAAEPTIPAAAAAPPPAQKPSEPAARAPAAASPDPKNAVYLSDQDLMKLQSRNDDGEVAE